MMAGCLLLAITSRAITVLPDPVEATSTPKCLRKIACTASCWYDRNSPWKLKSTSGSLRRRSLISGPLPMYFLHSSTAWVANPLGKEIPASSNSKKKSFCLKFLPTQRPYFLASLYFGLSMVRWSCSACRKTSDMPERWH